MPNAKGNKKDPGQKVIKKNAERFCLLLAGIAAEFLRCCIAKLCRVPTSQLQKNET
jgi:hypothetical protein